MITIYRSTLDYLRRQAHDIVAYQRKTTDLTGLFAYKHATDMLDVIMRSGYALVHLDWRTHPFNYSKDSFNTRSTIRDDIKNR